SVERLQAQAQKAVQEAAQAGRASRQLFEQASTLERIVRQHLILEDNALLDDYARVRQEYRQTQRQLALLPLDPSQRVKLEGLADSESKLYRLLISPQRGLAMQAQLADGYAQLADGSQSMLAATNQLTEHAIDRLEQTAERGRQKWLYLALATVAIA